ncbi:replication restart helicase PriA [Desulfosoma sp.]
MSSFPHAPLALCAVFRGPSTCLHYRIPEGLAGTDLVGRRVLVPLGYREAVALVVALEESGLEESIRGTLKDIRAVVDEEALLPPDVLALCRWMSAYYFHPLPSVLEAVFPSNLLAHPHRRYRLTAEGRTALLQGPRGEPKTVGARDVESALLGRDALDVKDLETFPKGWKAHIKRLESLGWVTWDYAWPSLEPSTKREKVVVLREEPPEKRLSASPHLRRFVTVLRDSGGTCPLSDLRRQVSQASYWVRKLAAEGFIALEEREVLRESPMAQALEPSPPFELTPEQKAAMEAIEGVVVSPSFKPFVLYGVTGSGKTEIYLQLVEKTVALGRTALVLVPEIALSTQLEGLFRARFGETLTVWHSALASGVRDDQWRKMTSGRTAVILGVRSAVLSPVKNLGLIIVDEEHDSSYKQEERLRYHARDVAVMRARMTNIPVILGSATPSLQSFHHGRTGRYTLVTLFKRVEDRPLPHIHIVDMRRHRGPFRVISPELHKALEETLESDGQAMLFLNRRGFASFFLCRACGAVLQCPHCAVSLTYHQSLQGVLCHYCGHEEPVPGACPLCAKGVMIPFGFGTERVEEELRQKFPQVKTLRVDRDAMTCPAKLVRSLDAFRSRKAHVMVGTQMITKGHDFPHVTLVGVINADTSLQISDFRSGETTAQLLMQVAGRAGRGEKPGRVVIQTYNPHHYVIQAAATLDYGHFCEHELATRRTLQYPPFTRMARLLVTGPQQTPTAHAAAELGRIARETKAVLESQGMPLAVLGPAPAPLQKLKKRFRYNLYVKAWRAEDLQAFVEKILQGVSKAGGFEAVHVAVDRDPVSSL